MVSTKVALITGGGSGIGRAAALRFALEGFAVVVADINEEGGREVATSITTGGGRADFVRTDVTDEGQVELMVAAVRDLHGRLDVAHINAGVEGERAPTHQYSSQAFDRVLSVNLRGAWLCLKHALRLMLEANGGSGGGGGRGSIVFTSSTAGLRGMPEFSAYSASKHALLGIARSAAAEYAGQGIRVNCVCPATTDTPMVQRFEQRWPEWQAATSGSYPLGRIATAEEVAEGVVFVATRATYMTGQALVLDGGSLCS